MNFSFLLGLCLFNLIHGRYLLVDVDDQQVREQTPPPPRIQETKPPAPTCIHPGGKCFSKTKFSISIEFSARSVKSSAECCQGYTCVSGMCLKPEIKIEGLGKSRSIAKKLVDVDYGVLPVIVCKKHQETCTGDGNSPKQYGDCCDGFKCRGLLGGNGRCFEASELVLPSLCRAHQEACGFQATNPPKQLGDCCVGMKCQRWSIGGAGKCVIDQCYFQYGFGSRMVPCCLHIISREEYDRMVEKNAERPILGSAFGKHHSCPKSAKEAHQILNQESNQKNDAPESRECISTGQTCMSNSECCSQNCKDDGTCGTWQD